MLLASQNAVSEITTLFESSDLDGDVRLIYLLAEGGNLDLKSILL